MRGLAVIIALAAALFVAPVADAKTSAGSFYGNGGGFVSFGLNGSEGADVTFLLFESIAEHPGTARVVIVDPAGVTPYGKCEGLAPTAAQCHRYQGTGNGILNGGDDALTISGDADGTWNGNDGSDRISDGSGEGTVNGGVDDDRLLGNFGDDDLRGDPGDDVLEGGTGDDVLLGDGGRDKLRGGPGADRIDADDGRRDRVIDCGPGEDVAVVNAIDPAPRHCERVRIRTGDPGATSAGGARGSGRRP